MSTLALHLLNLAVITTPQIAPRAMHHTRSFASALQILAPKRTSISVSTPFIRPFFSVAQIYSPQEKVEPSFPAKQTPLPFRNSYNFYFHRVASVAAERLGAKCVTPADTTWVGHFEYKGRSWPYVGFDAGLNSSAAKAACDDKTVTSALLKQKNIPHIEHRLFMKGQTEADQKAVWNEILTFFREHNGDIVIKPRAGTCGRGIFRIKTEAELKTMVARSFEDIEEVCLAPYYKINKEYRQIILKGKTEIAFIKHRPYVTGNGADTLEKIIQSQYPNPDETLKTALKAIDSHHLSQVPKEGEKVDLTWKHNLCSGASAELIDPSQMTQDLQDLAMATYNATGACFASVDVAELDDGTLLIMEVNNGVMFEFLAKQHKQPIIEKLEIIFEKALQHLFSKDS